MAGTNTLVNGPERLTRQPLTGLTVGEIRTRFNVSEGATAYVNDVQVGDEQVIVANDTILFAKDLGEKGVSEIRLVA